MSTRITSKFKIETWDEALFSKEDGGPDLIRASVKQSYSGALKGEGVLTYLLTTFDESFSSFIGTERVSGALDSRSGSFVLIHEGVFEDGVAKSNFRIEANSGTGQLEGIRGKGSYEATHEDTSFKLDYHFEKES